MFNLLQLQGKHCREHYDSNRKNKIQCPSFHLERYFQFGLSSKKMFESLSLKFSMFQIAVIGQDYLLWLPKNISKNLFIKCFQKFVKKCLQKSVKKSVQKICPKICQTYDQNNLSKNLPKNLPKKLSKKSSYTLLELKTSKALEKFSVP